MSIRQFLLLAVCACAALVPVASASAEYMGQELLYRAMQMTPADAKELEEALRANPGDAGKRALLVSYFGPRRNPEAATAHYFYLIEHFPGDAAFEAAGIGLGSVPASEKEKATRLWREAVEKHPENPRVLKNAAGALMLHDIKQSVVWGERALALAPKDQQILIFMMNVYMNHDGSVTEACAAPLAAKALDASERYLALLPTNARHSWLWPTAVAAAHACDVDKARKYAQELLDFAYAGEPPPNFGPAVHNAHLALGYVAVLEADLERAEEHLLLAARSPKPRGFSTAPWMRLPFALLQAGRRDVVLRYLKQVNGSFKSPQIDGWIQEIESGSIPDFGWNLLR